MTKRAGKRKKTGPVGQTPSAPPSPKSGGAWPIAVVLLIIAAGAAWYFSGGPRGSSSGSGGVLAAGSASGFNVLVVTLDTARADRIGAYGYAQAETPVMDALAAGGLLYADAVSHSPLTRPAHASMFTGLTPPEHGVRYNGGDILTQDNVTLAEILKKQDYDTAAFIGAFVLDARFGLGQGFDYYDAEMRLATGVPFGHSPTALDLRPANVVTDAALKWLAARDTQRPFFAWVHYFDPHEPYDPPSPYAERFRDRPYDGEIAFTDAQLGRLIDWLDGAGLRDRTLVMVVGDHGESLGEHEEDTHGLFIYEATMHVPLMLSCPGLVKTPRVVDDTVVAVSDVFPTVLDLLGVDHDGPCDGKSLLDARPEANRRVYIESMQSYLAHGWAPLYGLRRHGDKYIQAPTREYFDLKTDPNELENRFASPPAGIRDELASMAEDLLELVASQPSLESIADVSRDADPEVIRRLESLGYLSGGASGTGAGTLDPKDMMGTWQKIRMGRKLITEGRHEEALVYAREAQKASPHDLSVMEQIAESCMLTGRLKEAEETFRNILAIRPKAAIYVMLSQLIMGLQRYDEAELLIDKAAALEPNHGGVYIATGDLLAFRGRFEDALASYAKAAEVDPYRAMGMAQQRTQEIRKRMEQGWTPPPPKP